MMQAGLDIVVPDIGDLMREVVIRHDIVHRAGRTREGSVVSVSADAVRRVRDACPPSRTPSSRNWRGAFRQMRAAMTSELLSDRARNVSQFTDNLARGSGPSCVTTRWVAQSPMAL